MNIKKTPWNRESIAFYLGCYYDAMVDWESQLAKLAKQVPNAEARKKKVAYTILAPVINKVRPTSPVEALLFVCHKFNDFDDRNWVAEFEAIFDEDQEIAEFRDTMLAFGCIHPVEYDPRSRQALQWLSERAVQDESILPENRAEVANKLKNLILIYGPSAISNLFQKDELKYKYIQGAPNLRTGYHIERALHKVYKQDQLKQLKYKDIERAPEELVLKFNTEDTD